MAPEMFCADCRARTVEECLCCGECGAPPYEEHSPECSVIREWEETR